VGKKKEQNKKKQNEKIFLENKITSAEKTHTHKKNHLLHKFFALYVTLIVIVFWC
jgi:hypothetical protein